MVEYQEHTLHMCEDFSGLQLKENIFYGDLLKGERYSCYRLSRDKNLLNYIYGYKGKIDYVVMVTDDELPEIIKVENIPELLKLNPHGFVIESTMCMSEMLSLIHILLEILVVVHAVIAGIFYTMFSAILVYHLVD